MISGSTTWLLYYENGYLVYMHGHALETPFPSVTAYRVLGAVTITLQRGLPDCCSHRMIEDQNTSATRGVGLPDGILVYVLGMHRSGMSAVTEALLGFNLALLGSKYLIPSDHTNPRGYFEARPVALTNDSLLNMLGGSWVSPPKLSSGWWRSPEPQLLHPVLQQLVQKLAPASMPAVWKDPRFCFTLPLWREAIGSPDAAVLVYRHPSEVAQSLWRKDRMHPSTALALWERYNRAAITNVSGMPVLVVRYDEALADPHHWTEEVEMFLEYLGMSPPHDPVRLTPDFDLTLYRNRMALDNDALLPGQEAIWSVLQQSRGFHACWQTPEMPAEAPWITGMLRWIPAAGGTHLESTFEVRPMSSAATVTAASRPKEVRVRFATVAPGVEPWRSETLRLFQSIIECGGTLAGAEKICYFDRTVDSRITDALHDLEVHTELFLPVDPRCAMGNNQVMLDGSGEYDWLVALDCDVAVSGDFSHELTGDAVAMAPVDVALAPIDEWNEFYEYFNVTMPAVRYRTRVGGDICPPYFNAGVLLVPKELVTPLRNAWQRWLLRVADAYEQEAVPGVLGSCQAYVDQLSLALALADESIPHRPLPLAMNTPTRTVIDPHLHPQNVEPYILHYHHHVDANGFLIPSGYPGIDCAIEHVNRSLATCKRKTDTGIVEPLKAHTESSTIWASDQGE